MYLVPLHMFFLRLDIKHHPFCQVSSHGGSQGGGGAPSGESHSHPGTTKLPVWPSGNRPYTGSHKGGQALRCVMIPAALFTSFIQMLCLFVDMYCTSHMFSAIIHSYIFSQLLLYVYLYLFHTFMYLVLDICLQLRAGHSFPAPSLTAAQKCLVLMCSSTPTKTNKRGRK